ncbi:hypothetical protein AAF712_013556 [Marasmius tenuissimus]|uniref:FAD-binding PCMH-type domain-containing protein n=1 Tax=Marasmius tenuissimus TaxID=585030 RepID=A0ABR2ZEC7_9AGAR|nr:hypothetical protein PM082_024118 [Marasmius tenuissimus]
MTAELKNLGFAGTIITPTSPEYDTANKRFFENAILEPSYILQPRDTQDISTAIRWARSQNPPLEVAVKGGGANHNSSASTDGGLVIDLSLMQKVVVSEDKQSVSVEGGAVWGDVYAETDKAGVVPVGGNVHFVGVGGFTLAGGYSHLTGTYGLAIDNMIKATVILANGNVVETSVDSEPDLFWAIRGGVNQFGIVGKFVFKAYPLPGPITVGAIAYPGTELQNVLAATHNHLENLHPSHRVIIIFARAPPDFHPSILIVPYIENAKVSPDTVLSPFRKLAKPIFEGLETVENFTGVSHAVDQSFAGLPPRLHLAGALITDLWDDVVSDVFGEWVKFTDQEEFRTATVMWELIHRDKVTDKKTEDMAFSERSPHYYMAALSRNTDPNQDTAAKGWVSQIASSVRRAQVEKTGKALATPASFGLSPETISVEEVFGDNLPRLRELKEKYDPERVWSRGWVI